MTVFIRNVDIISLKRLTHIQRHSTNVMYLLCALTCVSLSASDDLDNRAFSACVRACVCVCACVCVRVLACQNCLFRCSRVVYLSVVSCLILIVSLSS